MIFLYFCLLVLKSLSQMAFYFSNLILQTANFKNRIGEKVDFSEALMALSYDLRDLAIKNISENKGLTPDVSNFYKKISSYGQLKLNWARGLASYGIIF